MKRRAPALPINAQIFATLRQRIIANEYGKSGSLAPEFELMDEFKVSRHTIRTALQKLVVDGLIERRRGTRTTIVRRDPPQGTWAVSSLDQLIGHFYAAEELFAGPVPAKRYPEVARLFRLSDDDSIFQVVRVLKSERGPLSHSTIFTRVEFGSRVPRHLISKQFFLTLLQEHCGLWATRARQTASAAIAPPEAQRALGLKENDPSLVLQRTFFSRSGEVIEHVDLYCRPDTYAQVVEFYREEDLTLPVDQPGPSKAPTQRRKK